MLNVILANYIVRFNRKPRQGLQFLQAQKLLGDSIVDVARFLLAEDRLDKTVSRYAPCQKLTINLIYTSCFRNKTKIGRW